MESITVAKVNRLHSVDLSHYRIRGKSTFTVLHAEVEFEKRMRAVVTEFFAQCLAFKDKNCRTPLRVAAYRQSSQ